MPAGRISNYRQELFLGCGLLRTSLTWTTADGRATDLVYEVLADRVDRRVGERPSDDDAALERPDDRDRHDRRRGRAPARPDRQRAGVGRIRHHGGRIRDHGAGHARHGRLDARRAQRRDRVVADAQQGASSLTATERSTSACATASRTRSPSTSGVDTALTTADHRGVRRRGIHGGRERRAGRRCTPRTPRAWGDLWQSDIQVGGQPELQDWVRSNLYALWSSIRAGSDNSIAPAGLSERQLRGPHLLGRRDLDVSEPSPHASGRREVGNRASGSKTLPEARQNAAELGYAGTFFPWNGAGTGDLEPSATASTRPTARRRSTSRATSRWPTWQYYLATGDTAWLRDHWPILRGVAEFWASKATAERRRHLVDRQRGRTGRVLQRRATTACSRTPARRSRCATPPPRPRSSAKPAPAQWTDDREQPPDAVRRGEPGLLAVRRLPGHADQAGRHRPPDLPARVADDGPGRRQHARLLRGAHATRTGPR